MGMEKENRTLETLLTMPVRRSDIIVAKIVARPVGLLMGAIYMAGFANYFGSFGGGAIPSLAALGISLNVGDYALIALSVFAALMAGLCLAIIGHLRLQLPLGADADLPHHRPGHAAHDAHHVPGLRHHEPGAEGRRVPHPLLPPHDGHEGPHDGGLCLGHCRAFSTAWR